MVTSHSDISHKMDEGTVNRTVRATNMNATSSRAHTIVTVTFIQKFKNQRGQETAKTAAINLVDLAGRLIKHILLSYVKELNLTNLLQFAAMLRPKHLVQCINYF